ncbi:MULTISPECIES: two-component system sensor histidine kinase PmrB [Edwardsiella]|uniref:histidine kinase n=2 Tax=Edwardsiella anguillarum TaxID=1821960 RepID=A0A076LL46_9GAMM|nr:MULTISPECIES: two-component system sensor histidine kinase PmrB [Edwardsiella]AKM46082.1 sensor protein BasS/PmrB [Edwardsiella sp. EA181011]GAJ67098.1 sensor protein BasS/PmrB [Edwardsiella piscicida]AIJ08596.1 Sensor protein basS/pmrB [Edwardsiella anguillarum ET080813]AKR76641.1 two-component system sensor histidine kinase PmrB [Edwardsiella sp. LADL05-105]KAB0592955.1 two-component system sensor histidine kinase PmrB [Edwardsiella anguillarum]
MISLRRTLLIMLALILLVTQLVSALWLWHESREQISFLVNETLSAKVRTEQVDKEIREAIAALLIPSLVMMTVTLLLSWLAVSWIVRPLNQLQARLEKRSPSNLTPIDIDSSMTEITSITRTLNHLFSRLQHTLRQERLFTADAAHELRTPLAGVRLHLELMEQSGVPEATTLVQRIDQLMHTVEQLLMLSRVGQNFASGHCPQLELIGEVVLAQRNELSEMLALRGQHLRLETPSRLPMHGDAMLLRLMLRNLVENAHRYSPEGSDILLRVTLSADRHGCILQVIDSGPGIDESRASELTEPFHRLDRRFGGSGLGLNIVVRILQLHKGQLTLRNNRPGPGLNACCRLPLTPQEFG